MDRELSAYVSKDHLSRVASFGLRGEIFFPVPCVLVARPALLGYYRMLYGLSQKEFYSRAPFGRFKRLEERNDLSGSLDGQLPMLCESLIGTGEELVDGIDELNSQMVYDLQLLTFGAQLRGSRNTVIGKVATAEVFSIIEKLVQQYLSRRTDDSLELTNESGRKVIVSFSSDPDISVVEEMPSGIRPQVAIEIKGGTDVSNVHNRIGEAEKSHQKAKSRGYVEFWTILAARVDQSVAGNESPTTPQFSQLSEIRDSDSTGYHAFRDHLHSVLGITGH